MFDVTESNDFVKTLLGTRASPAPRSNLPVVLPLTAFSRASFGKKKVCFESMLFKIFFRIFEPKGCLKVDVI